MINSAHKRHAKLYDNLGRLSREMGPNAPETIKALALVRESGRAIRTHYAGIAEMRYGRI